MARSKLKNKYALRASSILEVLISMVLILIVFTLAMMIAANVTRASLSLQSINAQAVLNDVLMKAQQSKDIHSQTFTINELNIQQEVKQDSNYNELLDISLTAYDLNQKKIATIKKVIVNNNE
jgi:Tfp pilus assembly protein PilV